MSKKTEVSPEDKSLVLADTSNYSVIVSGGDFKELMEVNLGGESIDASMLDRVIYPSGKSTMFIVPDENGEDQSVKTIEGIIVFTRNHRAYFDSDEITGDPPKCFSNDMITGIGEPGGECQSCAFNQFGSALKGGGKACKEKREVHLVVENNDLPIILDVPSASLKFIKKYLLNLATKKKVPQYGIVTKFSLRPAKSKSGTDYAELMVSAGDLLELKDLQAMKTYAEGYKAMITGQPTPAATAPEDNQQPDMKATGTDDDIAF